MRPPRIIGKDICYHIRVQCNNREFRFKNESDFELYEKILLRYVKKHGFYLYDYVLMHTHVHLIVHIVNEFTIDRVMRSINQVFAIHYNLRKNRVGHLWISPYRSSIIDSDVYNLCCMRYLDRNPLRAGIVARPQEWQWSGYNYYGYGIPNRLITPAPSYFALGQTPKKRQQNYRHFVEQVMPTEEEKDREWINSRWPKGIYKAK